MGACLVRTTVANSGAKGVKTVAYDRSVLLVLSDPVAR
jgi:hypothetical protein